MGFVLEKKNSFALGHRVSSSWTLTSNLSASQDDLANMKKVNSLSGIAFRPSLVRLGMMPPPRAPITRKNHSSFGASQEAWSDRALFRGSTEIVYDEKSDRHLSVWNLFHTSFIEVNEEGSEAAAASACFMKLRGLSSIKKIDFIADHPFLFLIRENMTTTVLFVGQVLDPSTV
ncbi:hypothetical protein CDL15_Pgr029220 [Punica granatum]|uniref:Serpin domain-containing protein n=1 Tax=Punica granatum TaxID=22663 RepID=A0A218XDT6_PUNGR|nr:hypothetical protein CDL15_Pgr029220 [Punica granatum]